MRRALERSRLFRIGCEARIGLVMGTCARIKTLRRLSSFIGLRGTWLEGLRYYSLLGYKINA